MPPVQPYSVPTPLGRVSTLIPELWSIGWLLWWALSMIGYPGLFRTPAWALLHHLPQPAWAVICLALAGLQAAGLFIPRLHRLLCAVVGLFWLCVTGGFLLATPLATGIITFFCMGVTLVYCATEARRG